MTWQLTNWKMQSQSCCTDVTKLHKVTCILVTAGNCDHLQITCYAVWLYFICDACRQRIVTGVIIMTGVISTVECVSVHNACCAAVSGKCLWSSVWHVVIALVKHCYILGDCLNLLGSSATKCSSMQCHFWLQNVILWLSVYNQWVLGDLSDSAFTEQILKLP